MRQCASIILCLAALCGFAPKSEGQLVGKWNFRGMQTAGENPQAMEAAKKQLTGSFVTFSKDKRFALTIGGKSMIGGNWTLTDHRIRVVLTIYGGQPIEKMKAQFQQMAASNPQAKAQMSHMFDDLHGSLSADGKTVTLNASATDKGTIMFSRAL